MENKAIQIEPKAATEMQSWTNIYDRVPSQYRQYVSYPTTTMKECPSKAEINSKLTHACTTYFEVLQLGRGILRVRPLYGNQTNTMRTCTVAVTAMGKTTYIYLSQDANPF